MTRTLWTVVICLGVIILVIGVVGYFLFFLPNIQATDVHISTVKTSSNVIVLNSGRVSQSATFSYTATRTGSYDLIFSNQMSIISKKVVNVKYTAAGHSDSQYFEIPAGTYRSITVSLAVGQSVEGSLSISGGLGNDIDFYIKTQTCSQQVTLSCKLVNARNLNGFAIVSLQSDGKEVWSNKYYVEANKSVPMYEHIDLPDCGDYAFGIVVAQQRA